MSAELNFERGGVNPLAVVSAVLVLGLAGLVAWLALSADETVSELEKEAPKISVDLGANLSGDGSDTASPAESEATEVGVLKVVPPTFTEDGAPADPPQSTATEAAEPAEPVAPAAAPASVSAAAPAAPQPALSGSQAVDSAGDAPVQVATVIPPLPTEVVPPPSLPQVEVGALPPAPDPALVERGAKGLLPIISADGRLPWQTYARPFNHADKRPRVAVVISQLGLSSAATQAAIQRLPGQVTLSFSPYSKNLDNWVQLARAAGHEVLLSLPMEPVNTTANDPGPHALLTSLSENDNLNRLEWVLGRTTGYVGVTNEMGSRFTVSVNALRPVLQALKSRGLLFLDSRSNSDSLAAGVASDLEVPRAINDRFVDQEASRDAIGARLEEIEQRALRNGAAVAMAFPYPITFDELEAWTRQLDSKGIALAPLSAVVDRQPDR